MPHYLTPLSASFGEGAPELITAGVVIAAVAAINIVGFSGAGRQLLLTAIAIGGVLLLIAVVLVGALTSFDASALTSRARPVHEPVARGRVYAGVIATVAYAGIEAASDLAPGPAIRGARTCGGSSCAGVAVVPILYTGVAAIAVMARAGRRDAGRAETPLASTYLEEPILGVVESYDPAWVADVMQGRAWWRVAPLVLVWAASTSMLGLSRHAYSLATNRQIPSWLGKLNKRWTTPHVAILGRRGDLAFGLVIPGDVLFLAACTRSARRSRSRSPTSRWSGCGSPSPIASARSACRSTSAWRGAEVPLPAVAAAVLTIARLDHGARSSTTRRGTSAAPGCSSGSAPTSSTAWWSRARR